MCDGKGTAPSFDGLRTLALHHQSALMSEGTHATNSRQTMSPSKFVPNSHQNSRQQTKCVTHLQQPQSSTSSKITNKKQDDQSQHRTEFPSLVSSMSPTRRSPTPEVIISDSSNNTPTTTTTTTANGKSKNHKSSSEKLNLFSRSSSVRKNSAENKKLEKEKEKLLQQQEMEQLELLQQLANLANEEETMQEKTLSEAVAVVLASLVNKEVSVSQL